MCFGVRLPPSNLLAMRVPVSDMEPSSESLRDQPWAKIQVPAQIRTRPMILLGMDLRFEGADWLLKGLALGKLVKNELVARGLLQSEATTLFLKEFRQSTFEDIS